MSTTNEQEPSAACGGSGTRTPGEVLADILNGKPDNGELAEATRRFFEDRGVHVQPVDLARPEWSRVDVMAHRIYADMYVRDAMPPFDELPPARQDFWRAIARVIMKWPNTDIRDPRT